MWLIEGALDYELAKNNVTLAELARDILECSVEEAKQILAGKMFAGMEQKRLLYAAFGDEVMFGAVDWDKSK